MSDDADGFPMFCPVSSGTTAVGHSTEVEVVEQVSETIVALRCPGCGGTHRYQNGRPTLAPVVFACGHCGDPVGRGARLYPGGRAYCDAECEQAALDAAVAAFETLREAHD